MKRFKLSRNWLRFLGIATLCLLLYIVVIGIFGNTDISPLLPNDLARSIQVHWPNMPFFKAQKQMIDDGKEEETFFTVPTRELTPEEIAKLKATAPTPSWFTNAPGTSAPAAR